ncbi:F510_1955 family glycosylhydrolase [Actinomycetospora rhizophila]|uniref:F510_1955 family glycosylhydrolase n=1 Tax=Actinomycetospora rhizophila TaxID=1416876 RepID=A0ABV9Z708_9PSEU
MIRPSRVRSCLYRSVSLVVAAVGAALLAGCAGSTPAPAASAAAGSATGHVHGLGVDPADGRTYVATHHGLYRVAATGLEKIGVSATSDRDLMGFLVAGPRVYLSSGHPAPDEAVTRNPLGLVRSTDGGASWQSVALDGEVDFHALDQGRGALYGVDSEGALRTSTNGGTRWESLPAPPALDVAAEPGGAGRVILAVSGGVATSTGAGEPSAGPTSFIVSPSPQLVFLSWAPDGELYGLTPDAQLLASTDGGSTWLPRGSVPGGRPQALTAVGQGRVLAATVGGIHDSRDGGRSFATAVQGPP